MLKTTPCINLALGFGSILSIAPISQNTKLAEISEVKMPDTTQNIHQYWQNIGGYMHKALTQTNN